MLTFDDIIDSFARVCPKKTVVSDDIRSLSYSSLQFNGSNLATDLTLDKNEDGKPFRKIKIVDITKHGGEQVQDPYGEWHVVPTKADIKINTMRVRHVKVKEIK